MTTASVRRGRLVPVVSAALFAFGLAMTAAPAAAVPSQNAPAPAPPAAAAVATAVSITDAGFTPTIVPIPAGQEVVWANSGQYTHTVVSDTPGVFASPDIPSGGQFMHTFFTRGTFSYHCGIHPSTMRGTIVVS